MVGKKSSAHNLISRSWEGIIKKQFSDLKLNFPSITLSPWIKFKKNHLWSIVCSLPNPCISSCLVVFLVSLHTDCLNKALTDLLVDAICCIVPKIVWLRRYCCCSLVCVANSRSFVTFMHNRWHTYKCFKLK